MPTFGEADWEDLRQRAVAIMAHAYAPYSSCASRWAAASSV